MTPKQYQHNATLQNKTKQYLTGTCQTIDNKEVKKCLHRLNHCEPITLHWSAQRSYEYHLTVTDGITPEYTENKQTELVSKRLYVKTSSSTTAAP